MSLRRVGIMLGGFAIVACESAAPASGWTLGDLLRPPQAGEIAAAKSNWSERDLAPTDVTVVAEYPVDIDGVAFRAKVISFALQGLREYGALFLPTDSPGPVPLILDIRGVSPGYPVRSLDGGPFSASVVAAPEQGRFAFAVPGLRGHAIEFADDVYPSEGDQRDSWDGAADDAIGFLSAVMSLDEPIDEDRVGVFGASRGGSVALLAASRDSRIDAAVAFAAPADWFKLMAHPGEDWLGALEAADSSTSGEEDTREAQFLEWFVEGRRQLPLAEARRRIIASSPLYFRSAGAAIQVHQGEDDETVPVANAHALERRIGEAGSSNANVFFYPDAGHDLSRTSAPDRSRRFLLRHLANGEERM